MPQKYVPMVYAACEYAYLLPDFTVARFQTRGKPQVGTQTA
jgi:hypothetical protein